MTTVKDLRKLAKERNMKGYSRMKKDQLLRILDIEPSAKPPDCSRIAKNCKGEKDKRIL